MKKYENKFVKQFEKISKGLLLSWLQKLLKF
jgi:hypothetical protein